MNLPGQCSNTAWNENLSTIKNEDRLLVKIFLKCIINYIYKVAVVEVIFVLIKEFTHNFYVDFLSISASMCFCSIPPLYGTA